MRLKQTETWYANIWIAGNIELAKQTLQQRMMAEPGCVTITPTDFIYTGGTESGMCIRMIQYPRFEKELPKLRLKAIDLAKYMLDVLGQWSCSVEMTGKTIYMTRRTDK